MTIEQYAEGHAAEHFSAIGWHVARVGMFKLGYDLQCTKADGSVLHVEVKGTRTLGEKIFLTANEVEHVRQAARCGAEHALYVVSQIEVSEDMQCSGGKARYFLAMEYLQRGPDPNGVPLRSALITLP